MAAALDRLIRIIGLTGMFAMSAIFFAAFVIAYLSPVKMVTLSIDHYNEANLEMILNIIFLPCMIHFIAKAMYDIKYGGKEKCLEERNQSQNYQSPGKSQPQL